MMGETKLGGGASPELAMTESGDAKATPDQLARSLKLILLFLLVSRFFGKAIKLDRS
jgi:hypothetical protein